MGKPAKPNGISEVREEELFIFSELPGELRYLLTVSEELPDVVAHAATSVRGVLGEISGDSSASVLQRSAVQLRSHADQIQRAACDILVLAGRLQGLAWASWLSEREEDEEEDEVT